MMVKYQIPNGGFLCFKHAVQRAAKDLEVDTVTDEDDFSSDYDMRDTRCVVCSGSMGVD